MSNTIDMTGFLNAIDSLVQRSVAGKYSQTSKGTVTEVRGDNKYLVSVNSNNSFLAHSVDSSIHYEVGDSVYILYTSNTSIDVTNYILGKENEDSDLKQRYNMVVNTLTHSLWDSNGILSIRKGTSTLSIQKSTVTELDSNNAGWNTFTGYLQQTCLVKFRCNITTNFKSSIEDIGKALYGFMVTIKARDSEDTVKKIDNFSMLGNPYFYENYEQDLVVEVPSEIASKITSFKVEFFLENAQKSNTSVTLNNFHLYIGEYDLNKKLKVSVSTELEGFAATKEGETCTVAATAKLIDNINEEVLLNNIKYFWFIKDSSVTDESEFDIDGANAANYSYSDLAGAGWRCLNQKEPYTFDGKDYPNYIGTGPNFTFVNTDAKNYENTYKCVARYAGTDATIVIQDSDEFKLYNFNHVNFSFSIARIENENDIIDNNLTFTNDTDERKITFSVVPNANNVNLDVDYTFMISYHTSSDSTERELDEQATKITITPSDFAFESYIFTLKVKKPINATEWMEFGSLDLLFTNSISPTERMVTETVYQLTNDLTPPGVPSLDYSDTVWKFSQDPLTQNKKYLWKTSRQVFWVEDGDSFKWGGFVPWSEDNGYDYFLTQDTSKQEGKTYYKSENGEFISTTDYSDFSVLYERAEKQKYVKREVINNKGQVGKYIFTKPTETDPEDTQFFCYDFAQMEQNPSNWSKPECVAIYGANALAAQQLNIFNQLTQDGKKQGFYYSDTDPSGYFPTEDTTIDPNKTYLRKSEGTYTPVILEEEETPINPKDNGWYEYFNRLYINANYIRTGVLQVIDPNNTENVIFEADINNGTVKIADSVILEAGRSVFSSIDDVFKDIQTEYRLYKSEVEFNNEYYYNYSLTSDTKLNPNKIYYNSNYEVITEPKENEISSYYEKIIRDGYAYSGSSWSTSPPPQIYNYTCWQRIKYIFNEDKFYYSDITNSPIIRETNQYFLHDTPVLPDKHNELGGTTRDDGIVIGAWADLEPGKSNPMISGYYLFTRKKIEYSQALSGITTSILIDGVYHYYAYTTAVLEEADSVLADWCMKNNKTFIDGGKIYTGTIEATSIKSNSITALQIKANTITANELNANAIKSTTYNYSPESTLPFSTSGSFFNLSTGEFITPVLSIFPTGRNSTNSNPEAYFRGNIDALSGSIGCLDIIGSTLKTESYSALRDENGGMAPNNPAPATYLEYSDNKHTKVKGIGSFKGKDLIIPAQVTQIEEGAFSNCSWLKTIKFEGYNYTPIKGGFDIDTGTPVTIGKGAFRGCNGLEELELPSMNSYLGYYFGADRKSVV